MPRSHELIAAGTGDKTGYGSFSQKSDIGLVLLPFGVDGGEHKGSEMVDSCQEQSLARTELSC
jgi:hypothetical protein